MSMIAKSRTYLIMQAGKARHARHVKHMRSRLQRARSHVVVDGKKNVSRSVCTVPCALGRSWAAADGIRTVGGLREQDFRDRTL